MDKFLRGEDLYGDSFDQSQIAAWFKAEEEGYFNLSGGTEYTYSYCALNQWHFFSRLTGRFDTCVAIGCATGEDVKPLAERVNRFIAVEPARKWWRDQIGGKPATYVAPALNGTLPIDRADIVTCFDVLHHIPNVTLVLSEIARVLQPGGVFLMREPVTSMGDWRKPRRGLTPNERGLPLSWLERTLASLGFSVERRSYCMFPATDRIGRTLRTAPYMSAPLVALDAAMSAASAANYHYHRDTILKKLAPSSVCYILRKN
jgi:SAM-dependent methyltransferase